METGVDFWLETSRYKDYIEDNPLDFSNQSSEKKVSFNINLVCLASIRKSISNFVRILTRKSIPVYFNENQVNATRNGKVIYISSSIKNKYDFNSSVGLALHEGSHVLLTNFDEVSNNLWAKIPSNILKLSDSKNIRRTTIERFIHCIWNIIEDRYIDDFVFKNAPGYREYYINLYNKYFNDPKIDDLLVSDEFRYPSLASYEFRLTNFTNSNTSLTALPRLDDIADIIDISNINRLTTTKDRIITAFKVVEVVLDCIENPKYEPSQSIGDSGENSLVSPDEFFGNEGENGEGEDEKEETNESSYGDKAIKEISNALSNKPEKNIQTAEENDSAVNKTNFSDQNEKDKYKDISKKQFKFLFGKIDKEAISQEEKEILDLIEQHGISLVYVGGGLVPGNSNFKIKCIVVNKLTKELIFKGRDFFPLSSIMKLGTECPSASDSMIDVVRKGISLGTKLGKKLKIRNEETVTKNIRKKQGKIHSRLLHEFGFESESLFYTREIIKYNKCSLHITVDASSSMIGEKWNKTMITVVAICKAASMTDNIHVTVSFRTTFTDKICYPYVILAYDSKVDKFSKVKNLFPYLEPNGATPEGLAFEAIMDLFRNIVPDETQRFLLNLSDGEPCFSFVDLEANARFYYSDMVGSEHTKIQIDKIRNRNVKILSYFICDETTGEQSYLNKLKRQFEKMYGKQAKFIDVNSVLDLSKTMNNLFLTM